MARGSGSSFTALCNQSKLLVTFVSKTSVVRFVDVCEVGVTSKLLYFHKTVINTNTNQLYTETNKVNCT